MVWKALLLVAVAGMTGGLLNAVRGNTGLTAPQVRVVEGSTVVVPGFVGNVLVGALAAVVSFALYGQFSSVPLLGTGGDGAAPAAAAPFKPNLTLTALAGAGLVGFSGGSWLSAEADKQLAHGTNAVVAETVKIVAEKARGPVVVGATATQPGAILNDLLSPTQAGPPLAAFDRAVAVRGQVMAGAGPP